MSKLREAQLCIAQAMADREIDGLAISLTEQDEIILFSKITESWTIQCENAKAAEKALDALEFLSRRAV